LLLAACVLVFPAIAVPALAQEPGANKQQSPADAPTPLPRGKKLVLKDGTFQLVRTYERRGDRVRYYSVERSAWEEMPADTVDWEATRKAEAEDVQRKQEIIEKMQAAEAAARAEEVDVDASTEIAPGVFLPEGEGLFALEGGKVAPLGQAGADVKLDKGRLLTQILVPVPVVPTRHKVQIAGKHAAVRLTTGQPEFYMRTVDQREPEIELLRAQPKGNSREIEVIRTIITGERIERRKTLPLQRWPVARGVYRFTLGEPLEPGEYALAEIVPGEGMNLFVWDFGIDLPPSGTPKRK
jgi:hypothetical protein